MGRCERGIEKAASVSRRFNYWLALLTGLVILFIMFITVALVFSRYVLRDPISWVMPVTQYLLLYSAMMGAAYVLAIGGHVNVDLVVTRLSQKTRKVLEAVTSLMGLTFCVILTWQAWLLTWDAYVFNFRGEIPLAVPLFPMYIIMPIGGALLCLEFILKIATSVIWLRRGGEVNVEKLAEVSE